MLHKFEISSFNHSADMEGVVKFQSRSCDPFLNPFDLILHLVPPVINIRAKFEVSSFNHFRYMEGVPKFQK